MPSEPLSASRDFQSEGPKASRRRRLPRCSARPVAHVTAAARPAGVARLIPRCRSSARSWLRDSWHASNAGCSRSWHQSHCIQAAIPKTKGPRRREDGVCLAARHALLLTSRPRHGRLALPVCSCAACTMHVLVSVTCETLHTPHGVARAIRANEYSHRFAQRWPQSFVLTAFVSLLGTPLLLTSRLRHGRLALPVCS